MLVAIGPAQHRAGAGDDCRAQVPVAALGDAVQSHLAAGAHTARYQTQPCTLLTVPGFRPIVSAALTAAVGSGKQFKRGRDSSLSASASTLARRA